jgi:hypothetical protein
MKINFILRGGCEAALLHFYAFLNQMKLKGTPQYFEVF